MRNLAPLALSLLLVGLCFGQDPPLESLDPTLYIEAPASLELGKDVKVGYRCELLWTSGEQDSVREFIAVVGETKDAWEVETTQGLMRKRFRGIPVGRGMIMALVVDKKTHQVLVAKIGNAPETDENNKAFVKLQGLKDLKVSQEKKKIKLDRIEEFRLPGGRKIEAEVYVEQFGKDRLSKWIGAKGSGLEGVLLRVKVTGGNETDYGLSGLPVPGELQLEDKDSKGRPVTIKVRRVTYSNGTVASTTRNALARAFKLQEVQYRSGEFQSAVVSLRKDAKKTLKWD